MLAIQNKQLNSIFERIVKDKNGAFVCIRFTVLNINGKLQGQIISVTPLTVKSTSTTESAPDQKIICLPCSIDTESLNDSLNISFRNFVSPYTKLDFLMSQPTRAPAL